MKALYAQSCIIPAINGASRHAGRFCYHHYPIVFIILCLTCIFTPQVQAGPATATPQQAAPLRLGLLPHLSSSLLIKKYKKLIIYLERRLQRRVIAQTAPDFKTYSQRVALGRYDLYLTAPHLAAFHESQHSHKRIAKFSNPLRGVIVVARDAPYRHLSDLQGKVVVAPDILAVITLLGEDTFLKNQLNPRTDLTLRYTPSHNNALHSVSLGKADAAIAGISAFRITTSSTKLKRPLRILTKTHAIPHMMFMSPGRVSATEREEFKRALLNINNDETGKAFIESVPFGSFDVITDRDMQALSDMVRLLQPRLER